MILENFGYQFICILIIGLIMGSFYNVIIVRTLSGESIIAPPSKCPNCNTRLKWWENIPVFSYLILNGKCSYCHNKINIMYPIIEILSAIIYGIIFVKFGFSIKFFLSIISLSIFLILAGMDIREKRISTKLLYLSIITSVLFNYSNFPDSISGLLVGGGIAYIIRKLLNFIFKKEVIGDGDIFAIMSASALCGLSHIVFILLLMIIFQLMFSLPNIAKKLLNEKKYSLGYLLIWFVISYIFAFFIRYYFIYPSIFLSFLIFLNLILSILFLCKYLFKEVTTSENLVIEAFLPSVFLSVFTFLFFI